MNLPTPSELKAIMSRVTFLMLLLASSQTHVVAQESSKYNRDIRPLLSDRCFQCHGPDSNSREADLRLDLREEAVKDRGGYWAIVPGDADRSDLWDRISTTDPDLVMPPPETGKPLSNEERTQLRNWIDQGATYEKHWAYAPLKTNLENTTLSKTIDELVERELRTQGLHRNPEADETTLLRRLHLDLTGLPPTREQIESYLREDSGDRYGNRVNQLLESPQYGERMAMYWLDLVRYADTVGYHGDQDHAITPYRDWVIYAFNRDMPFDEFSRDQLAGDLLPEATVDQRIASGYNRLLQTSHEGGVQQKEYLAKYASDRVRNFSMVWLGSTLGCCECHDHKYDPFTQRDFYQLAAFFADIDDLQSFKGTNSLPTKREPELEVLSPLDRLRIEGLKNQLEILDSSTEETGDPSRGPDRQVLLNQIEQLEKRRRRTMVSKAIQPRPIRVLDRGDWMDEGGPVVEPNVPGILPSLSTMSDSGSRRATRLDLAQWLFEENRPLTARVFVNRIWYLFFNSGLSGSLEDSGNQGEWPTHPELLDALASTFAQSQWSVKSLIREIVLSKTYRQSSLPTPEALESDPENLWLSHQTRYRLPAEMIRDLALMSSGLLVDELGGPSARPYQPAGYYSHLNFPTRAYYADKDQQQYRRGVYIHWQRQFLHPMLRAFDAPTREECTAQRPISNTPLAALTLLNDPSFVEAARVLAQRSLVANDSSVAPSIEWIFQQVMTRGITPDELQILLTLYESQLQRYQQLDPKALEVLKVGMAPLEEQLVPAQVAAMLFVARAILNTNEAITRN
ncbi:MAG: PSD1 and planctomycete cytochrome C domain-containing protein [Planctomycetota bacterium]|jgi:hypothetical protein|nr:PSD1 and planctomycete cytochrome C domain-containing protein [Planctomycetota bacterium]